MQARLKRLHGDPASKAAELMLAHKLGAPPVTDSDETLIGIVTETDFLRVALQARSAPSRPAKQS